MLNEQIELWPPLTGVTPTMAWPPHISVACLHWYVMTDSSWLLQSNSQAASLCRLELGE